MPTVRQYFKDQFSVNKFSLQHEDASDFYISSLQNNRKVLPLFCVRLTLFLCCLGTLVTSLVLTRNIGLWFIYMTNWGVILITIATGLAFAVSANAFFKGPIDSTFGLPWYIKLFWPSYNIAITIAFFITIFYYTFLFNIVQDLEPNAVLDVFVHGLNSVVMLLLLLTSRHPSHFLHCWQPLILGIVYMVFSLIYYYAGGLNQFGEPWIYPLLNWSEPGTTTAAVFGSAAGIAALHWIVVLISLIRDYFSRSLRKTTSLPITKL